TALGGSQYLDSTALGPYESYLWGEVKSFVETRYTTSKRAFVGKSSGGYAALVQAMRHPDLASAVACHSGDMAFEYSYLPDFPKAQRAFARHGSVVAFFESFRASSRKRDPAFLTPLNVLAMAAAYSPSPNARDTLGIDLPFDLGTGALREDVWARWLAHDP